MKKGEDALLPPVKFSQGAFDSVFVTFKAVGMGMMRLNFGLRGLIAA